MAGKEKMAAHYAHKSAITNYLPKVSATGAYMHTSRELSLLSDEQKSKFSNIGTGLSGVLPDLAPLSQQLNAVGLQVLHLNHNPFLQLFHLYILVLLPHSHS